MKNANEFESFLEDVLLDSDKIDSVGTFDDERINSKHNGLVVVFEDGVEYKITIERHK
ncbi:hypothetical protein ACSHUI_00660 [Bacillus subtilis]|uniref:hypothetical protein n=1 Tax=Bacillus subtilis TaxID=1423 RepID=UPI0025C8709B|nr:hypothetical protein [Bacillus subtilis]WCS67974.1 hypothetical protein Goe26_00620 [Bacillus phage vB_BsuM-Goe26]GLI90561.1 hypothetical protein ANABIO4_39130 [Bacillus subtilis]